jgi:uncharacterized protein
MEDIYIEYLQQLNALETTFRRDCIDTIPWAEPLLFILGARGVGKTTLILQYIKEQYSSSTDALYISMDDISLANYSLIDVAKYHYNQGGQHLFIDEVHKYPNWSQELKNIRDKYKTLKVTVSGSSLLEIQKGNADLSRRSVLYILNGLSFREFLNIETDNNFPSYTITDILDNHTKIATAITKKVKPLQYFGIYLQYGYYPFYLESHTTYATKLMNTVNVILEQDMAFFSAVEISKIPKIKKLIYLLSVQVPYEVNITKLAAALETDRVTLLNYLSILQKASILFLARYKGKLYTALTKPDKIYLQNTNLLYLSKSVINIGTQRETFFANQLNNTNTLNLSPNGNFLVNQKYTIEVGGSNKDYKQIANIPNSYLAIDDITIGINNKIPLWLFGFLY